MIQLTKDIIAVEVPKGYKIYPMEIASKRELRKKGIGVMVPNGLPIATAHIVLILLVQLTKPLSIPLMAKTLGIITLGYGCMIMN